MKVLIFGASGKTGQHLVRQALDNGHQVTEFVRNPDKLTTRHAQLMIHTGNVNDFNCVSQAVKGQQVVLSALGADNMFKLDKVVVEGMNHILRAMERNLVSRIIYLSTLGVKQTRRHSGFMIRHLAPTLLRTEILGHEERENMISLTTLDWSIVRAPILTNGPLTRNYKSGENLVSKKFVTTLSRANVASFMLSLVTDPACIRKSITLMSTNHI